MPNVTNNEENIISVSVIDYIGKMEDGVALLLSVMIFDQLYEIAYWFNQKGQVRKNVKKIRRRFYIQL